MGIIILGGLKFFKRRGRFMIVDFLKAPYYNLACLKSRASGN